MGTFQKIKISVCLGSSCFSRGNGKNVERLQKFIAENYLENYVELVGNLCEEKCDVGPNMKIGCEQHQHLTEEMLKELLADLLVKIKQKMKEED